ncbi:MAG: LPP20 family lipoprotein [Campylobacterota bacterium]|nr:LPP20 family lipoprotein [Campylobacterota bacterium]
MIKILLLFTAALLIFSGCGSQKRVVVAQKVYPPWYVNPPQSNTQEMYETGEGSTKEEAINNALSMMISTLSVSIESSYHSKTVENQGVVENFQKTVSNEIKSDVKKIRISHYDVIKTEDFGFKKYLVLLKADKRKIFESLEHELNQRFSMIDKRQKNIVNESILKQITFYQEVRSDLADVPDTLTVMNVLDKKFDGNNYLNKIETLNVHHSKLLAAISFSINSNIQAKNLVASVRNGLSDKHYHIEASSGKNHFRISLNSHVEKAKAYGFTLARSAIAINVKDYKGMIIGSNKLNIIGQSTQGYEIAKENVAIKFNNMVEKEGIEKVLGLSL